MDDAVKHLPHSRYQHVFVIMRVDRSLPTNNVEESIKAKKVVMDQRYADQEVERLNSLNGDKDTEYYWQIAQLDTTGTTTGEGELT